jgi:hypothetical protein
MTISPEITALAVQIEERLAARMQLVVEPLADAILSLQQNQTTLVGAVNGLTEAVAELRTGQRTLEASMWDMQRNQRALDTSVRELASRFATTERLAQIEQRLASIEARLAAANDRS